jgi:hypothetical protein
VPEDKIITNVIGITGNRDYPDRAGLFRGLDRLKANRYYLGGARGADTDALEYLGKTQPASTRTVVVPNTLAAQPVSTQGTTARYATEVIELNNTGPDRFQIRNRYIVDHSDRVAAFTDGRKSGGTYNTIRYAELKGVPVDIQPLVSMDKNVILAKGNDDFLIWMEQAEKAKIPRMAIKVWVVEYVKGMEPSMRKIILKAFHRLRI